MREIQGLPGCEMRLDARPHFLLSGVGEQVLQDRPFRSGFLNVEERFAGFPAMRHCQVPGFSARTLADDYLHTVVPHVLRLTLALYPIAQHSDRLLGEYLADLFGGVIRALNGMFDRVTDSHLFHGLSPKEAGEYSQLSQRMLAIKYLSVKILDSKIISGTIVGMEHDLIDQMNAAWREQRPDLDPSPLDVVGRLLVIAGYLDKSVNEALGECGLTLGQFDILATLRRQGPNGRMTPTQLMKSVMLTSGGMTNRIDRLEIMGWIARLDDPEDRRGVVVMLTETGRRVIDEATEVRFQEAEASLPPLNAAEMKQLTHLLRRWLIKVSDCG